jgi:hypothetical protein
MNVRRAVITLSALALLLAGVMLGTAAASTIKWVAVPLGAHQFGHVRTPEAIVARAGVNEVGFKKGGTGCGCTDGPGGPVLFDVAPNGSIWLFDVLNRRLLVWQRGKPAHPARTIKLNGLDVRDFALGRDGTIYLNAVYVNPPSGDSGANLWALSPSGKVRWRTKAEGDNELRLGPNGALYSIRSNGAWTPLTTSTGRPLSLTAQRRQTTRFQPLAGGLHLIATQIGAREIHFALVDHAGKVVRAWRVTSRTPLALAPSALTPSVVGGELVVQVDVSRQSLAEHMILRLKQSGTAYKQFSLNANALCCYDPAAGSSTPLRVASDGLLYQLRTNPQTGATVARYPLGAQTSKGDPK